MSKVKLSLITAISLSLILLIGVLGYGCAANKNLKSADSTLVKKSQQTTGLSQGKGDSIYTNQEESSPMESNRSAPISDIDNGNNSLLPAGIENKTSLEAANDRHDRLRPEIRRILHAKFSSEAELKTALDGASILQDYLEQPNQDAVAMIKRYDCSVLSLTQADQNLIQSLTFDTDARKNKIKNGLKDYQPAVSIEIQIDNQGNAISPCSIVE